MATIDRRNFLRIAGLAAPTIGLAACTPQTTSPATMPMEGGNQQGGGTSNDEMDAMHEKGIKMFLDGIGKDKAFWGTPNRITACLAWSPRWW